MSGTTDEKRAILKAVYAYQERMLNERNQGAESVADALRRVIERGDRSGAGDEPGQGAGADQRD
jgi:hypothetical protein